MTVLRLILNTLLLLMFSSNNLFEILPLKNNRKPEKNNILVLKLSVVQAFGFTCVRMEHRREWSLDGSVQL